MEHTIYLICAVAGCTLVGIQLVLQLMGFMGDVDEIHTDVDGGAAMHVDVDHGGFDDHDHAGDGHGNLFFGILSLKALTAFFGFFGITGLVLEGSHLSIGLRVLFAIGAGTMAMLAIARLMMGLSQLQASGTIEIRNAVGHTGTVYTRVPEKNTGWGKVTVEVQGRSLELRAVTDGPELKSGARVAVVALAGDETLKVQAI